MKETGIKRYLYLGFAGFVTIATSVVFFFCIYRADAFISKFNWFLNILMPFIYGGVMAYLLAPVCNFLERRITPYLEKKMKKKERAKKVSSSLSILLGVVIGFTLLMGLFYMVLPQVWESIISVVNSMPENIDKFLLWTDGLMKKYPEITVQFGQVYQEYVETINQWLKTDLIVTAQKIVNESFTTVFGVFTVLKNLLIGVIVSVYLLASRKLFVAQAKKSTYGIFNEKIANGVVRQFRFANTIFGGFIRGKLLDSLIIGILCFVACYFMKMPYIMLISVIIGVTNIIPFFGPFIGAIPCTLLVLTVDPMQSVYFVIFIIALQQFDGNILGPKILGQTTGISGFWVLFSILLFGGIWGPIGMIVGVPLFAVIYAGFAEFIKNRLKKRNLSINTEDYGNIEKIEDGVYTNIVPIKTGSDCSEKG